MYITFSAFSTAASFLNEKIQKRRPVAALFARKKQATEQSLPPSWTCVIVPGGACSCPRPYCSAAPSTTRALPVSNRPRHAHYNWERRRVAASVAQRCEDWHPAVDIRVQEWGRSLRTATRFLTPLLRTPGEQTMICRSGWRHSTVVSCHAPPTPTP